MKKIILVSVILLMTISSIAQEKYSRVKIFATNAELAEIAELGIEVDHGQRKKGVWLSTDISVSQINTLEENGFDYEIEIDDVSQFYFERNLHPEIQKEERDNCGGVQTGSTAFSPSTPSNFNLGTMAGFYTYQEFLDELDEMATLYPNLINAKSPISTFTTHEGRPIHWVRISDNPNVDENENEVMYSAIHHAREPVSLTQTIFYMWYLLENYGTNSEITYLLDNTELYFVPMINPDGYIHNEVNTPGGGGMHRKNKRNVGTSNPGVDLNRNYSYHWNETGTTQNVNGDTYAGTGAFSEPETQAIKWFCENHDFEFAHNAHSYGNLLLFPLGWETAPFAADHDYFTAFTNHQVMFNNFNNMKSSGLYPAAGDSDDWMYIDDLATKPKIYAMTPEVGGDNDGFWPAQARIIPICKSTVWMNLILAHLPHVYGATTDTEPSQIATLTGDLHYSIERLGLENGPITVSVDPLVGIQSVGGGNAYTLNLMDIDNGTVSFVLNPTIVFGDEIKYVLKTSNGLWTRNDTIVKTFGAGTSVFLDDCNTLVNWTGDWGLTSQHYYSPGSCITDSPGTDYSNQSETEAVLNDVLTFENATYAYANFYAKWEIETDWDFVEFMISTNNGTSWSPLCGKYTHEGGTNQDVGNQLYDGFQTTWVQEEVDLTDYLGMTNIRFKFRLVSDNAVKEAGFSFDDFQVFTDGAADTTGGGGTGGSDVGVDEYTVNDFNIYPNPANSIITIYTAGQYSINSISVYNNLGQLITLNDNASSKTTINISDYENGVYFVKISTNTNQIITKKFTVLK
jgi:carboxypeptidase T